MTAPEADNATLSLAQAFPQAECQLGDDYAYGNISQAMTFGTPGEAPVKVDGMMVLLVSDGALQLGLNMERHTVQPSSLVVIPHGSLINLMSVGGDAPDVDILFFSTRFLRTVNINFTTISVSSFIDRDMPAQPLEPAECALIKRYITLLRDTARQQIDQNIERNIAASLMAAMVYQLVEFHYKRIGSLGAKRGQRSYRNQYAQDFIKLVHVHYKSERTVGFYASKLCISSKYLSMLVKEMTGKSAAKWIDDFVLMEAKNLLRFSGKNVQQVAYALNFTNQSAFGKYFKHLTGQSPTDYQKS